MHDLGGLRVGMNICYDGSFPESSRVLALMGADLILLPTNWPTKALCTAQYLAAARALENRVFYMAVNRVGDEAGFHFIGQSRIHDCTGDLLAVCEHDRPAILAADIDPERGGKSASFTFLVNTRSIASMIAGRKCMEFLPKRRHQACESGRLN